MARRHESHVHAISDMQPGLVYLGNIQIVGQGPAFIIRIKDAFWQLHLLMRNLAIGNAGQNMFHTVKAFALLVITFNNVPVSYTHLTLPTKA